LDEQFRKENMVEFRFFEPPYYSKAFYAALAKYSREVGVMLHNFYKLNYMYMQM